jgi:hypothetical protein
MKEYNIQLYKMEYVEDRWINFVPRRYLKKFKSLSDLAKYIYNNGIYMSSLYRHIAYQLTNREYKILNAKICAMYNKYHNEKS